MEIFDNLKARLVASGDMQEVELSGDISSPSAIAESVTIVAAIAAWENWQVDTMDISGACLNAPKKGSPVYIKLSAEVSGAISYFDPPLRHYVRSDGTIVVKLMKIIWMRPVG